MDLPTSTLFTLASATPILTQATSTPTSPSVQTNKSKNDDNNDETATNIIFGVLAVILALIGILLAWLQIRSLRHRPKDHDDSHSEQGQQQPELEMQVVETYTLTRHKTLRLPKMKLDDEHGVEVWEVD